MADLEKAWKSAKADVRKKMVDDGTVLSMIEIGDDGVEVPKIVSKLASWNYDEKTGRLDFVPEHFHESEADPVVFIDKRDKIGARENKWNKDRPLRPRWEATVTAVIGVDTGKEVVQYPAKISLRGAAADPGHKDNLLGLYVDRSFRFFEKAKAKVEAKSKDGKTFYLDGKSIVLANEKKPKVVDIQRTLDSIEKVDQVNTGDLSGWCSKYADKMSETKDYQRCFYIRVKIEKVQKFPSGDVNLQLADKYTPRGYFISANMVAGTRLDDYGVTPGSAVHIFGRAYMKKKVYNWSTSTSEDRPWPHVIIHGMKPYIDVKSNAVADALAAIGMGASPSFVDDGEEE
jgi:hypothetical protein